MNIFSTIIPIFIIIFLGLFAKQKRFITPDFLNQANRLVYYIAIPAMIFSSISKASLNTQMNLEVILITLVSLVAITAIAFGAACFLKMAKPSKGTFIQCAFHGNLGYIGLAVAFYYLGNSGFVKAAIIAGFVMILQNILAVIVLQYHSRNNKDRPGMFDTMKKTMANPVILSALAGILFSLFNIAMPLIIDRALDILKGMALPLALLIIGASLSFEKLKPQFLNVLISCFLKVMVAPAIGFILFKLLSVHPDDYLPGLIILSSPSATLTYIMAKEIGGDPDFAVAAISICTIMSGLTYGLWLTIG
ncbi:AEC family transporter [Desulfobacula sp.]|uniref:AEC family transporter n=1 Tax=Desulfobacula sp. TaxID=2593537 RepID=UPI0025B809F3|nr:AEC family transporter [Desulfobacula sp.]MBC2705397.1 AEC family transporter [Desulfobacula sp.]